VGIFARKAVTAILCGWRERCFVSYGEKPKEALTLRQLKKIDLRVRPERRKRNGIYLKER
jgi:hypothetical protein